MRSARMLRRLLSVNLKPPTQSKRQASKAEGPEKQRKSVRRFQNIQIPEIPPTRTWQNLEPQNQRKPGPQTKESSRSAQYLSFNFLNLRVGNQQIAQALRQRMQRSTIYNTPRIRAGLPRQQGLTSGHAAPINNLAIRNITLVENEIAYIQGTTNTHFVGATIFFRNPSSSLQIKSAPCAIFAPAGMTRQMLLLGLQYKAELLEPRCFYNS